MYCVQGIRVLEHTTPLLLIGSDLLRGGRSKGEWNFGGWVTTTQEDGNVTGQMVFNRGVEEERCDLTFCPAVGGEQFVSESLVGTASSAPVGGGSQCLRPG